MQSAVAEKLIELNRQFYQEFAPAFSETRQRLQPGVIGLLERIPPESAVLDLGCGNGALARELARRGHEGAYVGLDFSQELLHEAQKGLPESFKGNFLQADLSSEVWESDLPLAKFQIILCFASLHHLPGEETRLRFLGKVHALLAPRGRFMHSNWQFLNSARLKARIQSWESISLNADEVDPGDYLLDWRRDGAGLRYVHHFSAAELRALAAQAGFDVKESFTSDGEGGNLGLYQVWEKASSGGN